MASCSPFEMPCGRPMCGRCFALRRQRRDSFKRTGIVLCVVGIILLLTSTARCEEPADEARPTVLDVGEGVLCKVPGVPASVPLPPGKMVPTHLWTKLDDRFRVLEASLARERAERAETERQFAERLAQVIVGSLVVGIAAGAAGAWIVQRPP